MATGTVSNVVVYNDEMQSGMVEVEAQNIRAFNQNSAGTIRLRTENSKGDYVREAFWSNTSSLVGRRDVTSVSTVADTNLAQDEHIAVKVSRRAQVGMTRDSLRKIRENSLNGNNSEAFNRELSFVAGQQLQVAMIQEMLNTALACAEGAIDNVAAINYDNTAQSPATLTHAALINGLALFGDRAPSIAAWVMHSGPFYDLAGNAIGSAGFDPIANTVIREGGVPVIGRQAVISDSSSLTTGTGSTLQYQILGLVPGAIEITRDGPVDVVFDTVTGLVNLVARFQAEWDYTIRLKGYKWDTTNGGTNPDDTALALGTNWDKVAADDRDTAGVHVLVSG